MDAILTGEKCWELIKEANWQSDHNYERIRELYMKLSQGELKQLLMFVKHKIDVLEETFRDDWLGKPGISVSDDGWFDLKAEVVGRGKEFYQSINKEKLRKMADEGDYYENFVYSLYEGF